MHVFGREQGGVLLGQRGIGVAQDLHEIFGRQRVELDANRKAPLQFGDQVRGSRQVERTRGDKQNVIGADHAVFGGDSGALDQWEQIALYTLARDVRAT